MERSKEEYLELIKKRQIRERDLPKELLDDEEFVRQVYPISMLITRFANIEIAVKILKEEIEKNPLVIKYFPKEVILRCEADCMNILKGKSSNKFDFLKSCPKEILLNNIEVCEELLANGMILNAFPKEVLLKCKGIPSAYITNEGIVHRGIQSTINSVESRNDTEKAPYREQEKNLRTQERGKVNRGARYINSPTLQESPKSAESLAQVDRRVTEYDESQLLKKLMDKNKTRIGAEWQEECLAEIKDEQNVILSSPTGSGKTRVFLEWAKQKQERPIYITAPIKALSNQRWRELREQGFIVGLETGDIKYIPENCDFICCTQEIYRNKYTEQENVTLIMDEFHYIFDNNARARAYIDALHDSKAKNILLCSATFGKMSKLVKHVGKVSGRDFHAYENHDRLTELEFRGKMDKKDIKNALVVEFNPKKFKSMCDEISLNRAEKDEDEINKIRTIAQKYELDESELEEYAKKGVMYYYGEMLPKEKLFIEELFENKLIDTVVGTDALAMGVNFPIENVVFAEIRKSKNLFDQLAGRAGRKGYFDKGYAYYCNNFEWQQARGKDLDIPDLYYKLLFSKNESISISLTPHIKDILIGQTTIEEELEFIAKYSTESVDLKKKREKIESIIDYIQKYDLVKVVIKKEFGKEINKKMTIEEEIKLKEEIEDRKKELMPLQEEFEANIASAYFEGTGVEINCNIFKNILLGRDLDQLIKSYGKSFRKLLEFRQYVNGLPKIYRQSIDMEELENRINSIDSTVLNFGRGALSTEEIASGVREELLETDKINEVLTIMAGQLGVSKKKERDYGNEQIGA